MRYASLGSGSKGNATLVEHNKSCVLIDCGFSLAETRRRLEGLGRRLEDLTAVLVTHEHSDHIRGVSTLAKKLDIPVYMTAGTCRQADMTALQTVQIIADGSAFHIGDMEVLPVTVPHDAREPSQFIIAAGSRRLGILTDLGSVSAHVQSEYANCHAMILEGNHDPQLLASGPYPQALKRRVAGDWGHLSNQQAVQFLQHILQYNGFSTLRQLVVAHISETNNSIEHVEAAFSVWQNELELLHFARQDSGFEWIEITE